MGIFLGEVAADLTCTPKVPQQQKRTLGATETPCCASSVPATLRPSWLSYLLHGGHAHCCLQPEHLYASTGDSRESWPIISPSWDLMRPRISQGYIKGKQHMGRTVPEQDCCKLPRVSSVVRLRGFFGALAGILQWCGYLRVAHGLVKS